MSLTIPLAELTGGVAPRIRVEAPQDGAMVADFGQRVARIGDALETDRLDREAMQARLRIQRDLGQAALDMEQIGRPEELDAAWAERIGAMRTDILGGVDPKNAERLGLAFDEVADRYTLAQGRRSLELRQGERRATWDEHLAAYAQNAAGMDAETRQAAYDQLVDSGADLFGSGAKSMEEVNADLRRAKDGGAQAAALRAIDADPQAFLGRLDAGEFQGLDPVSAESYRARATKAVEVQENQRRRAIDDELVEMTAILRAGRVPAQIGLLDDPAVQSSEKFGEFAAAAELLRENADLGLKSVGELDAMIAEESARPVVRKYQTERLEQLKKRRNEAETGWRTDPIAFAQASGLPVTALPEFDPANPNAFAKALRARTGDAAHFEAQGYGRIGLPLSLEEQAALKTASSVETPPEQRAALAGALASGLGLAAAEAVSGDALFAFVGGMMSRGGEAQGGLARDIFRGAQAMDEANVVLPPVKDRLEQIFGEVEDLFADLPGGEARQARIAAAADALYAARQRRIDPAGAIDGDAYKQALHEVMGGTGRVGRPDARGGVQEVRGQNVLLPRGVSAAEVEGALRGIGTKTPDQKQRRRGVGGATSLVRDDDQLSRQLSEISISGAPPEIGGSPIRHVDFDRRELRIKAVADNQYVFVWNGQVIEDANGGEYRFRMNDLLRAGSR